MLAKASSRSASPTSSTWSKRASALRTCLASVSGSLRCSGKANTESGRSLCSAVEISPWLVWGFQVVLMRRGYRVAVARYPQRGDGADDDHRRRFDRRHGQLVEPAAGHHLVERG